VRTIPEFGSGIEIMKRLSCSLAAFALGICLALTPNHAAIASDLILQKVPLATRPAIPSDTRSQLSPQATFALINYKVNDHPKVASLYVSSGEDLTLANKMIDNEETTSFGFSAEDKSPAVLLDLGRLCPIRKLSAIYSARPGSMDFYVLRTLPSGRDDASAGAVHFGSDALANLKPVGSAIDDGSNGRASIVFPAMAGRYVMLRWIPAAHETASFTIAEVGAVGRNGGPLLASSGRFISGQPTTERSVSTEAKDFPESKDVYESKDIPGEAPEEIPPRLPDQPPFTFIPQLVPVSL
jgi:hypothetical protein